MHTKHNLTIIHPLIFHRNVILIFTVLNVQSNLIHSRDVKTSFLFSEQHFVQTVKNNNKINGPRSYKHKIKFRLTDICFAVTQTGSN